MARKKLLDSQVEDFKQEITGLKSNTQFLTQNNNSLKEKSDKLMTSFAS